MAHPVRKFTSRREERERATLSLSVVMGSREFFGEN
jgi:hypothetical protein